MARVLVADDVKDVRDLLKAILEQDSHIVVEAENGQKVLSLLQSDKNKFDLILLDIGFPDIDGTTVMKRISEMEGELPKVCFVSGEKNKNMVMKALQAGGSDYIVKPIDILVLKSKLAKFLNTGKQQTVTIEADLIATLPNIPLEVEVKIIKISELGLTFTASLLFNEKSSVDLTSQKINSLIGEVLIFSCLVESSKLDKKTNIYSMKCCFLGIHERQRSQLRKILLSGKKISDNPDSQ